MVKRYGKNRISTMTRRTIRRSFPRFVSLMIMSLLGVFAFSGLMATAPDMIRTLDQNLDAYHAYDIRLISDMGLTDEDVDALAGLDGVENIEAVRGLDTMVSHEDSEFVVHLESLPVKLNQLELLDGRMPETSDEIVVEESFLTKESCTLGSTVTLENENLTENTVTIVGTVESALYYNNVKFTQSRGNTSIGSGTIKYYAYGMNDLFDQDYYTTLYLTVIGAAGQITADDGYTELVDGVLDEIKAIKDDQEQVRYEDLYADGLQQIEDAREEADEKLNDAQKELKDSKETLDDSKSELDDADSELQSARQQLDDADAEIASAKETLAENKTKLDDAQNQLSAAQKEISDKKKELAEAQQKLTDAKSTLDESKAQLDAADEQLEEQKSAYESALSQAGVTEDALPAAISQTESGMAQIQSGIDSIQSNRSSLEEQLAQLDPESEDASSISAQISALTQQEQNLSAQHQALQAQLDGLNTLYSNGQMLAEASRELEDKQAEYDAGLETYQSNLADYESGQKQIAAAEQEVAASEQEYQSGLSSYQQGVDEIAAAEEEYLEGESEYAENVRKYEDGLQQYQDGLQQYNDGLDEYNEAKEEADQKISDSMEELNRLDTPNWYLYDRTGYSTYGDYIDASHSIRNLARVFPVVFFAVALLVSLISMNRMVEENRLEVGTLKSMGFPNSMILKKYLVFSFLATALGSVLGAATGLTILPKLIYHIYSLTLFNLPPLVLTLQPVSTLLGFVLTVLCVCGSSVWTVHQVLREKPAELLRPKPPKNGKRILLERIPLIWNHLKFSRKITARNIFRYKKRVLVTIGGIAGCTALMLTGFGIKDAIVDIPTAQYCDVFQYDATAYVTDYGSEGITAEDLLDYAEITSAAPVQYLTATIEGIEGALEVIDQDDDLPQIAAFKDAQTGELLKLEPGKAIINEKLAAMTGLETGDRISLIDVDNHSIEVEIGGVAVNYVGHFVMMDAQTYEDFGFSFQPNMVFLHTTELNSAQKDTLSSSVLLNEDVQSFTYRDKLISTVDDSLKSLNSVVLILIVLSALLAFVVFYNLSNINISEREREIATLKVLGFYNHEVDSYITKENILLTVIGVALGLILGIFLSHTVVNTIEIEKCRFMNTIKPVSYLYSALLTLFFTGIVNVITHFNLKRIHMIDSLKSVE